MFTIEMYDFYCIYERIDIEISIIVPNKKHWISERFDYMKRNNTFSNCQLICHVFKNQRDVLVVILNEK